MEQTLIQVKNVEGENLGLYRIPNKIGEDKFLSEWNKFPSQDAFDEENEINAVRIFVEEIYIDNPF